MAGGRGDEGAGALAPAPASVVVRRGERPQPFQPPPVPDNPLASMSAAAQAALPNLIVIGAAKCGTSALHDYLSRHPAIGMTTVKEAQLFGGNRWLERLPSYAELFDATRAVRGESSPSYTLDPYVPNVPEQMAAVLPEPRFIYLVADPVARVVAHWAEARHVMVDQRPLAEAVADAEEPANPYVAGSRYGHQLQRYVDVFGLERVLVIDQLDLRDRRRETLRTVFEFAGVDPSFWVPELEIERNAAQSKIEPHVLGRWMEARWGARAVPMSRIRGLTGRRLRRPELDDAMRRRLSAALARDIERFRELTGRPFEHWEL